MNCLERSHAKCAGGAWLEDYSYVVLEHGMVDKKCGVCPNHNYTNLERALHGKNHHQENDILPSLIKDEEVYQLFCFGTYTGLFLLLPFS